MASQPAASTSTDDLLLQMWDKHEALIDFLQTLNGRLLPDDRPKYEGVISNAELEVQRLELLINLISNNKPIPFPSDQQVQDLQKAVGALQKAVTKSANTDALVAAATAVIKAWPVSGGR